MNFKKLIFNKDFLCILVLILCYALISLIITKNGTYIMGSNMDFSMQHYIIPEYFRELFYKNHDLFPDFAFNLGAGENIYYLSYYGLLSPIILISYLFPNVSMLEFIIWSTMIVVLSSVILFYFYLKKNNYSRTICFLCSFMLLCAAPLIFHSHRHIMFINYLPFLILGLYGVDNFVYKKKSLLLIISITLMIFTSYYFSVSGIIVLFIFGIFKYIKTYDYKFKNLFKFMTSLSLRIIISILIGSILILPTLYTLFSGRTGSNSSIAIIDLFKPDMYMLYSHYSMGLSLVCFIGTIYMLFYKKKENRFLSVILLLVSIFPIFNFVLNGMLYTNGKTLIPFIFLALINMADCLNIWFSKLNKVWKNILIIYILIASLFVCLSSNTHDSLISKEEINKDFYKNYSEYIDKLDLENDNLYRTNTSLMDRTYINKVENLLEYKTTMYSSAFNSNYKEAYSSLFHNSLPYRNKFMMATSNNILFQMYMGEKYIITKKNYNNIYEKIYSNDEVNIYKNDYVLPIGYATNKIINKDDFDKLNYPDNIINLLGAVVTSDEANFKPINSEAITLDKTIKSADNVKYSKTNYGYKVIADEDAKMNLKLNNDLNGKLLFISFDILENVSCDNRDLNIKINGVENTLTCKEWKYNNGNTNFNYVLFDVGDTLKIKFDEGTYKLGNFKTYTLDFDALKDINKSVNEFIIDKEKTTGDKIIGSIDVKKDGYFSLSIPYDEGFEILVDNKKINYEKINEAFIGFKITEGKHNIEINYKSPYKDLSLLLSFIGIVLCLVTILFERRCSK